MMRVLVTAGLCLLLVTVAWCSRLVCHYDSAAASRPSVGHLDPETIDPTLCTHIVFGFADIDNNKLVPARSSDPALYKALTSLRTSNSELKIMLSVGGPNFDNEKFSMMARFKRRRSEFVDSTLALLQTHSFDGLNLDWRYPGNADSDDKDKRRFILLCQDLKLAFDDASLILSATVAADEAMIDSSYPNTAALALALEFFNVFTLGFHDSTSSVTAHHSPLSSNTGDTKTTEYALNYWSSLGVPAEQLVLGIGAYGVAFTLEDTSNSLPGADTTSDVPTEHFFWGAPGIWPYHQTCMYVEEDDEEWISEQSVPYAVSGVEWIGFDNKDSIDAKVSHIMSKGYGGASVWGLEMDDSFGVCQDGLFPFVSHLRDQLGVTVDPCNGQSGVFPNPDDPSSFYNCGPSGTYLQDCPDGLVFDTSCSCCERGSEGVSVDPCNGQSGVFPNPEDPSSFYNCGPSGTYLQDCPEGLVFDTSCSCCNYP